MIPDDVKPGTKVYWVEHDYDTKLGFIAEGTIEGRLPEPSMDFILENPPVGIVCYRKYLPAILGSLTKRELVGACLEQNILALSDFLLEMGEHWKILAQAARE